MGNKQIGQTLIKSRESIMSINIVQQKRVMIEDDEIRDEIVRLEESGDIETFCIKEDKIREFTDLDTVMKHPIAALYFRLYCVEHQLSESFLFLQAVSEYKETQWASFLKIYDAHIKNLDDGIPILERDSKKLYEELKTNNIGIRTFDDIKRGIHASLSSEAFGAFLKSKFAYARNRVKNRKRFSHIFNH